MQPQTCFWFQWLELLRDISSLQSIVVADKDLPSKALVLELNCPKCNAAGKESQSRLASVTFVTLLGIGSQRAFMDAAVGSVREEGKSLDAPNSESRHTLASVPDI